MITYVSRCLNFKKKTINKKKLTSVRVTGVEDGDGRSYGCVVKHGNGVGALGEVRRVVVYILDHQQDIGLTGPPTAVRRLGHQVVLGLLLPVQLSQTEELP